MSRQSWSGRLGRVDTRAWRARNVFSGAEAMTTNNRMELRAAIEGLATLPHPSRVRLTTDSQYVRTGVTSG